MRMAAIVLAALSSLAMDAGVFVYWISSALACLDSCPSVPDFTAQWLNGMIVELGPGVTLSLLTTAVGLLAWRLKPRSAAFIVTLLAPIAVAISVALILQFVAGSFTPVPGASIDPTFTPTSSTWITGAIYASLPLAVWPFVTFLALLVPTIRRAPSRATP